ncbi:hypothetical protein [Actinoallomurus rhizosphaericola]|uniref:hypothetical protein n=1 Tax=Actinoallomurus rhizosphaericola TaxID=2952536 RepID=UPI0020921746|nr:hypothetical protein [Actinoallomurus rhizosphaericola]MCO5994894.1 hypothetical protein [Actinoallomurus rhizosphaericola]
MDIRGYGANRPYATPESLEELTGPVSGRITLPGHLDSGPRRTYDLDEPSDVRLLYMRVIRESSTVDDLRRLLNVRLLRRVWAALVLPPRVRRMWESRFSDLHRAA